MKASRSEAPERKRKRPQPDQPHLRQLNSGDSSDGTTTGAIEEVEDTTAKPSPGPPGDEEVEEFFAILRRMHAAVKYYGKSGHGDDNRTRRWTALDVGLPLPVPSLNGGAAKVKKAEAKAGDQAKNSVSFDLNTVPAEAAEAVGD